MTTTQPAAQPGTPASTGRDDRTATPVVAVIGTGRMGGPMAANLARGGFDVRVWNRTVAHAEPLAADGAVVAASPADAVLGATIVITMLADGAATEQAATGPGGLLDAGPGIIWVQMGTVGVEWTTRLAGLAADRGAVFVDADGAHLDPDDPGASGQQAAGTGGGLFGGGPVGQHRDDDRGP
jgi:3-hydroxyisobutyrate dehydrogenase